MGTPSSEDHHPETSVDAANPEDFLHLFVKNSRAMVNFLEHMILARPADLSGTVYNTLLEHYLHQFQDELGSGSEERVMDILRNNCSNYDADQALILCQLHGFSRGILHLFERKQLFGQILWFHVQSGDLGSALQTCRTFGPQDPNLWVRALQYVAKEADAQPQQVRLCYSELGSEITQFW